MRGAIKMITTKNTEPLNTEPLSAEDAEIAAKLLGMMPILIDAKTALATGKVKIPGARPHGRFIECDKSVTTI